MKFIIMESMEDRSLVSRNDDWLWSKVGEDVLMMDADSGAYVSLKGAGSRIWELIDRKMTVEDLCAALISEHDADAATVHRETVAFLADLEARHAVRIDPPAVA
jgi:hypothetical protein